MYHFEIYQPPPDVVISSNLGRIHSESNHPSCLQSKRIIYSSSDTHSLQIKKYVPESDPKAEDLHDIFQSNRDFETNLSELGSG